MNQRPLEIRNYSSAEIDDLESWVPEPGQGVFFSLSFEVAEAGTTGSNLFQAIVATPAGLQQFKTEHPHERLPDRGVIVLETYSWEAVLDKLTGPLKACTRESWDESMACLSRQFLWEYEDYR